MLIYINFICFFFISFWLFEIFSFDSLFICGAYSQSSIYSQFSVQNSPYASGSIVIKSATAIPSRKKDDKKYPTKAYTLQMGIRVKQELIWLQWMCLCCFAFWMAVGVCLARSHMLTFALSLSNWQTTEQIYTLRVPAVGRRNLFALKSFESYKLYNFWLRKQPNMIQPNGSSASRDETNVVIIFFLFSISFGRNLLLLLYTAASIECQNYHSTTFIVMKFHERNNNSVWPKNQRTN